MGKTGGLVGRIKNYFSNRKKEKKTTTEIAPKEFGIKVTDFTSGESVISETRGGTTTRTYYRGSGGGTSQIGRESAIAETEKLAEEQAVKRLETQSQTAPQQRRLTPSGESDKVETIAVDVGGKMEDVKVYSKDGKFVKYERFENPFQLPFGSKFIESGRVGKTPKEVYNSIYGITGGTIRANEDILTAFVGGGGSSFGERYNPNMNMYGSYSEPSGQATAIYRPPTQEEQIKIDEAKYRGDFIGKAVTGVPRQIVSPWSVPFTEEEWGKYKSSFTPSTTPFIQSQFEIFKSRFDYERNLKEANEVARRLENLNKNFETRVVVGQTNISRLGAGNISSDETTGESFWTGTQSGLDEYNKAVQDYNKEINRYSVTFSGISSTPEYQRVINSPAREDVYQRIASSSLSPKERLIVGGAVSAVEWGSYRLPFVRVITGADMLSSGFSGLSDAKTTEEKLNVGFNLGVGSLLVTSGFKGGSSLKFGSGSTSKLAKVGRFSLNWGLPAGLGTYQGFKVTERTGDIYTGIGAGVGGFVGLKSPEIYRGVKQGVQLSIKKINQFTEGSGSPFSNKKGSARLSSAFEESGELRYDYVKGKWVRKTLGGWKEVDASGKEISVSRDKYLFQQSGKTFKIRTPEEQFKFVEPELTKVWATGDVKKLTAYKSFLEQMYGKKETAFIFKEFFMQQGIWVGGGPQFGDSQFTKMSSQLGKSRVEDMQIQTNRFEIPAVNFLPSQVLTLDAQSKIKQKQKSGLSLANIQTTIGITKGVSGFATSQITEQKTAQQEIVIPKEIIITRPKPPRPITPKPYKPIGEGGFFPFPFPKLPFGTDRKSFIGDVKAKRSYQYFPSFKAIAFNIRGKGEVPSPNIRWTGLETRPIFKKRKKGGQQFNFPLIKF